VEVVIRIADSFSLHIQDRGVGTQLLRVHSLLECICVRDKRRGLLWGEPLKYRVVPSPWFVSCVARHAHVFHHNHLVLLTSLRFVLFQLLGLDYVSQLLGIRLRVFFYAESSTVWALFRCHLCAFASSALGFLVFEISGVLGKTDRNLDVSQFAFGSALGCLVFVVRMPLDNSIFVGSVLVCLVFAVPWFRVSLRVQVSTSCFRRG